MIRLEPFRSVIPFAVQNVVPSACPWMPWSVAQTTWAVLPDAVPLKLMVLCEETKVGWVVGDVMLMVSVPVGAPPLGVS